MLHEITAPDGYVLDTTPVAFTINDTAVQPIVVVQYDTPKREIVISKSGEKIASVKTYPGNPYLYEMHFYNYALGGAFFTIYAEEDIVVNGEIKYTKGSMVAYQESSNSGYISFSDLYPGVYRLKETFTPDNYVKSEDQIIDFTEGGNYETKKK